MYYYSTKEGDVSIYELKRVVIEITTSWLLVFEECPNISDSSFQSLNWS